MLKVGTSVFHCSCPTHRVLSKQFCLLISAINKIIVLNEAFWQLKYSLEITMRGLVGLLQGGKSNFLRIKKQQAQPTNSCNGGEQLYFLYILLFIRAWQMTETSLRISRVPGSPFRIPTVS